MPHKTAAKFKHKNLSFSTFPADMPSNTYQNQIYFQDYKRSSTVSQTDLATMVETKRVLTGEVLHTFTAADVGVNYDLRSIEEVSKLRLPDGQNLRRLQTDSILKAQHRLFRQNTVSHLEVPNKPCDNSTQRNTPKTKCLALSKLLLTPRNRP